jgi:hypothetical protein
MSLYVAQCPRCNADKVTFDVWGVNRYKTTYGWREHCELHSICRNCNRSTIFLVAQRDITDKHLFHDQRLAQLSDSINKFVEDEGYICIRDMAQFSAPDHVPDEIKAAFNEAAVCMSVDCPNAAATMFRMCLDMATRSFLPAEEISGLNAKTRRDLGLRLPWLFDNKKIAEDLRDLSHCVKEDGNDGAHAGTLTMDDAEDLKDFTIALLERLYTEPARIEASKKRREERRATKKP